MQYLTLLTQIGAQKIAAATAANTTVQLTHIAVGDSNGTVVMPNANQTALINEVFRASLNNLSVDANNSSWVVTEGYIGSNDGNFWIREVGIFDVDGDLIAVGNYPETFKPLMADGVAKDLYLKVIIEVSSTDAVTLQIDPSIIMASREFVNEGLLLKADLNGSDSETFKVAAALANDEAVNKQQMTEYIDGNMAVLQVVYEELTTSGTGTSTMPQNSDTPTNINGNEILTVSITPKRADSKLLVIANTYVGEVANYGDNIMGAIFRDDTVEAIIAKAGTGASGGTYSALSMLPIDMQRRVPSNDTVETTFKLRVGVNAGACRWNGVSSTHFGGSAGITSMLVMEVL